MPAIRGHGRRCEVGDRRGCPEAHFDHALHSQPASLDGIQEHIGGLDPAHRRGELPGEQLHQQLAGQPPRVALQFVPVLQDPLTGLATTDLGDGFDVVAIDAEGDRMQVRHVAADQRGGVDLLGERLVEVAAEVGHAGRERTGVERHVDARHQEEGRPPRRGSRPEPALQLVECCDGSRHRVLSAAEVVVDDLAQLAGRLRHRVHQRGCLIGAETSEMRSDHTQSVLRSPGGVPFHQMVHRGSPGPHDAEDRFERQHAADRCQRVVLPHGVTRQHRIGHERPRGPQLLDLGGRQGGHRDLGELGEVEHTVGMAVLFTANPDPLRVATHHVEQREPEVVTGEPVGTLPDVARGRRAVETVHAHAAGLDPLTREHVGGANRGNGGEGPCDDPPRTLHHDLDPPVAVAEPHTGGGELHLLAGQDHVDEVDPPVAESLHRAAEHVAYEERLRGGRGPHAVHDPSGQPGEARQQVAAVDGVEIARHQPELLGVPRAANRRGPEMMRLGVDPAPTLLRIPGARIAGLDRVIRLAPPTAQQEGVLDDPLPDEGPGVDPPACRNVIVADDRSAHRVGRLIRGHRAHTVMRVHQLQQSLSGSVGPKRAEEARPQQTDGGVWYGGGVDEGRRSRWRHFAAGRRGARSLRDRFGRVHHVVQRAPLGRCQARPIEAGPGHSVIHPHRHGEAQVPVVVQVGESRPGDLHLHLTVRVDGPAQARGFAAELENRFDRTGLRAQLPGLAVREERDRRTGPLVAVADGGQVQQQLH